MNTLKINDIEYDMSSPSGLEFKKKYITSFGDSFGPSVDVSWHHVNGFYLEIKSDSENDSESENAEDNFFDIDNSDSEIEDNYCDYGGGISD
jgi:hypothetical protein